VTERGICILCTQVFEPWRSRYFDPTWRPSEGDVVFVRGIGTQGARRHPVAYVRYYDVGTGIVGIQYHLGGGRWRRTQVDRKNVRPSALTVSDFSPYGIYGELTLGKGKT
jgi:hypothetical protein